MVEPGTLITGAYKNLLLATAVMTTLLVIMGGVVCATESGLGCPDWPGCYGRPYPPPRADAIIEYSHRISAVLASTLIVVAAVQGWRRYRSIRWVSRTLAAAIPLLIAVSVFGAFAVLTGLSPGMAALDLGSALLVLALVVTAAVTAAARHANPARIDRLSTRTPISRLAVWTLAGLFVVLVSGVLVAESNAIVRCLGWPFGYSGSGSELSADTVPWPQLLRNLVAGVTSILTIVLVVQVWRTQRGRPALVRTATAVGFSFLVEMAVGAFMLVRGASSFLLVTYVAAAVAHWALLTALTILAATVPISFQERPRGRQE